MRTVLNMVNIVYTIISNIGYSLHMKGTVVNAVFCAKCSLAKINSFVIFRKLTFAIAAMCTVQTMANSLNHHFRQCAHYGISHLQCFETFEIALCFAHFSFYEISTPVMPTMLVIVNVVQIIISDIVHTVYITFTVF